MTRAITTAGFDYGKILDPETEVLIRNSAAKIRDLRRGAVVDVGRELLFVKQTLKHGEFDAWVEQEFGWSKSTALNYMRVATMVGDGDGADAKYARIAHLPAPLIYDLAAPSVDESVKLQVLDGTTPVSVDHVRRLVHGHKEARKTAPRNRAPEPKPEAKSAPTPTVLLPSVQSVRRVH